MAILSQRLYKDFPEYFKFFKEPKFTYKGHVHQNHNRLLAKIPDLNGIKTGFINASGFNLAASVVRDNRPIIAVVMGGESAKARDKEIVKLIDATYSNLQGGKESSKGKKFTAVHRTQPKPKILKTKASPKYRDLGHLLNDLDDQNPSPKKIKKSSKKGLQKKSKAILKPVSSKKKKVSKLHTA
jgi:D-alanyl-D-alanine carboxypeptidase